ncbi:MAG: peptidoglycan-binding domain-containing protein [Sandaracinaceae bacterium]|nr:MAG: hypothetical protein EVA89_12280 [Sandaracinaceae bacterium]
MLKMGDRGPRVRVLQEKLVKLGYEPVKVDGIFGQITQWAVLNVQAMFGYTIDGLVGQGTQRLLDAQLGYGWCAKNEDAMLLALKAQGLIGRDRLGATWA